MLVSGYNQTPQTLKKAQPKPFEGAKNLGNTLTTLSQDKIAFKGNDAEKTPKADNKVKMAPLAMLATVLLGGLAGCGRPEMPYDPTNEAIYSAEVLDQEYGQKLIQGGQLNQQMYAELQENLNAIPNSDPFGVTNYLGQVEVPINKNMTAEQFVRAAKAQCESYFNFKDLHRFRGEGSEALIQTTNILPDPVGRSEDGKLMMSVQCPAGILAHDDDGTLYTFENSTIRKLPAMYEEYLNQLGPVLENLNISTLPNEPDTSVTVGMLNKVLQTPVTTPDGRVQNLGNMPIGEITHLTNNDPRWNNLPFEFRHHTSGHHTNGLYVLGNENLSKISDVVIPEAIRRGYVPIMVVNSEYVPEELGSQSFLSVEQAYSRVLDQAALGLEHITRLENGHVVGDASHNYQDGDIAQTGMLPERNRGHFGGLYLDHNTTLDDVAIMAIPIVGIEAEPEEVEVWYDSDGDRHETWEPQEIEVSWIILGDPSYYKQMDPDGEFLQLNQKIINSLGSRYGDAKIEFAPPAWSGQGS